MSFSMEVKLFDNVTAQTSASFFSDPPYELGWAKEGNIWLHTTDWGNADNQIVVTVQWGVVTRGLVPIVGNINWVDGSETVTVEATDTTTDVSGLITITQMKSKYMRLKFALTGTGQSVKLNAFFYGKSV